MSYSALKEECRAANIALPATGLVDLTFGNVSVADRVAGVFAIKPSGVPYEKLTDDDIVILDFEGKIVEGQLRPSSDTPTHRRLFLGFPNIRSVVHTHSRYAVSFAQAGSEIPLFGTTHADYFRGNVPVTRSLSAEEIADDYEWATGDVIVERFANLNPAEIPAVLVRHHGPFAWGSSGEKAVETAQALEVIAQMALQTLAIRPQTVSPTKALIDKHFLRKHGSTAYYGQKNSSA